MKIENLRESRRDLHQEVESFGFFRYSVNLNQMLLKKNFRSIFFGQAEVSRNIPMELDNIHQVVYAQQKDL